MITDTHKWEARFFISGCQLHAWTWYCHQLCKSMSLCTQNWQKEIRNLKTEEIAQDQVTTIFFFLIPHAIKYHFGATFGFWGFDSLKTSRKQRSGISLFLSTCFSPFYNLPPPSTSRIQNPHAAQGWTEQVSFALCSHSGISSTPGYHVLKRGS